MKRVLLLLAAAAVLTACGSSSSSLPGKPTKDGWWEVQEKPAAVAPAASAPR